MKLFNIFSVLVVGIFISIIFFYNWVDFLGFIGFLSFFGWNIFAYTNRKNMISLPMMLESVKFNENPGARIFLFVFSWIMIIIIFLGYIYKSINS